MLLDQDWSFTSIEYIRNREMNYLLYMDKNIIK